MTLGYVLPVAAAVWGADAVGRTVPAGLLKWIIVLSFFAMAAYLLLPEKEDASEDAKTSPAADRWGPFWTGFGLVMIQECLDKSQITTAGLALKYRQTWPVFSGSLSAQAILNLIYAAAGRAIALKVPEKKMRHIAAAVFAAFGLLAAFGF
jgi:Ca2+/H+ antiporter, TMEM165/GDT1 family